jgi:hypothetical protein
MNVSVPIDVEGLTYGAAKPKKNAEIVPPTGPSIGAVKLEDKMLARVIQM